MKKIVLTISAAVLVQTGAIAAQGIGVVDYEKIVDGYSLAQKYKKELDTKAEAIKTYVESQDKSIASAKTHEEAERAKLNALSELDKKQKDYIVLIVLLNTLN